MISQCIQTKHIGTTLTGQCLLLLALIISLAGCSGLLFYPYKTHVRNPAHLGLVYRDARIITRDNIQIHGWLLPQQGDLKGSVYFLHGNAENVSTHIMSVAWLPEQGYQVFMIDYRGFGLSEGKPSLPEVFMDIEAGFDWLLNHSQNKPVILLGQSLGASMGLFFAATQPNIKEKLAGVISDSAFTGYAAITRAAAARTWLTWPLQYPVSWLMAYPYNPIDVIDRIAPIPLLVIHGTADDIIPYDHGQQLYQKARSPKQFLTTEDGHIQSFMKLKHRQNILEFLNRVTAKQD